MLVGCKPIEMWPVWSGISWIVLKSLMLRRSVFETFIKNSYEKFHGTFTTHYYENTWQIGKQMKRFVLNNGISWNFTSWRMKWGGLEGEEGMCCWLHVKLRFLAISYHFSCISETIGSDSANFSSVWGGLWYPIFLRGLWKLRKLPARILK